VEAVILFPAIDLKDGLAVRLQQGDMARATVFNRDPASQAHAFEQQGFRHLHVVDLDGAFAGKPMNVSAVERILETVGLCVQLGGGIRDMKTIDGWLEKGVNRVIIGTAAVRDPMLVKEAAKKYPKRIAVGLDARDGKVAVEGWAEQSELTVLDIARRFEDAGVAAIVYTDVARADRTCRGDLDSGDRLGRAGLDRRHSRYDAVAGEETRRRDRRPRALRRAARCHRGAENDQGRSRGGTESAFRTAHDVKD
jgi:phosphoribosylformimino-5-aminoimidazole carboxamide ribotide isomerase